MGDRAAHRVRARVPRDVRRLERRAGRSARRAGRAVPRDRRASSRAEFLLGWSRAGEGIIEFFAGHHDEALDDPASTPSASCASARSAPTPSSTTSAPSCCSRCAGSARTTSCATGSSSTCAMRCVRGDRYAATSHVWSCNSCGSPPTTSRAHAQRPRLGDLVGSRRRPPPPALVPDPRPRRARALRGRHGSDGRPRRRSCARSSARRSPTSRRSRPRRATCSRGSRSAAAIARGARRVMRAARARCGALRARVRPLIEAAVAELEGTPRCRARRARRRDRRCRACKMAGIAALARRRLAELNGDAARVADARRRARPLRRRRHRAVRPRVRDLARVTQRGDRYAWR